MTVLKTILSFTAGVLIVSHVFADTSLDEITAIEPAIIEQMDIPDDSPESVPEPETFGAICLGVATVIYARRWRRRS